MNRREWTDFCLSLHGVYEDHPFDEAGAPPEEQWTLVRHLVNKKTFVFLFQRAGCLSANLKCDPMLSGLLRGAYPQVTAGYHMNKTHWITVPLDGSVPEDEVKGWISESYDLTKPNSVKKRKSRQGRN